MFPDKTSAGARADKHLTGALVVRLINSTVVFDGQTLANGSGAIICAAARKLIARGYDPKSRLEAWRGDTLCVAGLLSAFAKLTVRDNRHGRPIFCRYQTPPPGARIAPPVAQSTAAAIPLAEAAE